MPYLNINSNKIYYHSTGQGTPIIFLHNGFYSSATWENIRNVFAQYFKVIEYDRLGYGQSSKVDELHDDLVLDGVIELENIVNKLNLEKFNILGHCLGGAIGLKYALKHPEKVIKIVAESVGFYSTEETLRKTDWSLIDYEYLDEVLKNNLEKMHGKEYMVKVWNMMKNYRKSYIMSKNYDIRNDLKKLKTPILIINGDRDYYFDINYPTQIYKMLKNNAQLFIAPNAGHDVHVDTGELFIQSVIKFFKE